jgi:ketosteroid isomerase-like protein
MRNRTCRLLTLAPTLLLGVVCVVKADEAADRVALDSAQQAWIAAFNAHDADAMAALTTVDIVLLPPNALPVRGREAVRAVWRQATSTAKAHATVTNEETVILGEFAWSMGAFTHTLPNGAIVSRGKFVEIWQRVDGQWKIHRDMFSSNAAAAKRKFAPVPRPSEPVQDARDVK